MSQAPERKTNVLVKIITYAAVTAGICFGLCTAGMFTSGMYTRPPSAPFVERVINAVAIGCGYGFVLSMLTLLICVVLLLVQAVLRSFTSRDS